MRTEYGITYVPSNGEKPWRAQTNLADKNYTIGSYETKPEAQRAYDNVAYWVNAQGLVTREKRLNFPQDYESSPLPETARTREIILDVMTRGIRARTNQPTPQEYAALCRKLSALGREADEILRRLNIATESD
jgi:hypothetical protein